MLNITITLFTFIFLVAQNVLLLNEESLILLCFISFIGLSVKNLGTPTKDFFSNQSSQIANLLKNSLKQILEFTRSFITFQYSLKNVLYNFIRLKKYYFKLTGIIKTFIPNYNKLYLSQVYKNQMFFINKVENQTIKLLVVIIIQNLDTIIKSKRFYRSYIKSSQFLCLDAISLRESIKQINSKNK